MRCNEYPPGKPLECCHIGRASGWTPKPNLRDEFDRKAIETKDLTYEIKEVSDIDLKKKEKAPKISKEPEWEPGEQDDLKPKFHKKKKETEFDRLKAKALTKGQMATKQKLEDIKGQLTKTLERKNFIQDIFENIKYRKRKCLKITFWILKLGYISLCIATVVMFYSFF